MKTISLFEVVPDPYMLMTSPVLSAFQVVYSFVFENVNSLLLDELNLLEFQTGDGSGAFFLRRYPCGPSMVNVFIKQYYSRAAATLL